ncbi:MAG: DUF2851 family protein [Candidatus Marinimicrobia bacterium]|nr:DUF2851 family protein [Candidatus Neomarinimicrobiota bacterium]
MRYLLPSISSRNHISESADLYEIDLVRQWLNLSPGTIIETTESGKITVINAGLRNKHEGPDIKEAILIISDKIVKGPVECHICTSDWYNHGHHKNPTYESVILHVVRTINDGIITPTLPTILLKPDINHSNRCSLNNINKSSHLIDIILYFSQNRWLDKINIYNGYHDNQKQLITILINNSFRILGAGGNENQFVGLANNINYKNIQGLLVQEVKKYLWDTSLQLKIKWVKRGIRPAQQPQNRMQIAVEIIHYFLNLDFNRCQNFCNVKTLFTKDLPSAPGKGIQKELLGNVIIPFYAARALYLNKIKDYYNYYGMWNRLKLPNAYRKFAKRFGTTLKTAQLKSFSTLQGLIAIDNNWCGKHLCHLCPLKKKHYADSQ